MKNKNVFVAFIIGSVLLISGCGTSAPKTLYTWNNYEATSQNLNGKEFDSELVDLHMLEIEKIINDSSENNQKVAPGLYAEYAQLLYQKRKKSEAKKYFLLEKQVYPESAVFIDQMLKKLFGENLL
jgi:hypothetical protein